MEAPEEKMEISEGQESVYSTASRNKKYLATAVICYCTFAYGSAWMFLGPTIVDFSHKFDKDVDQVSIVFTVLFIAYLVGALINGILNRFVNRQVFVVVLLAVGSAVMFVFPHVGSIGLFFMLAAFLGIFAGGYDSAQIAWIIDIWRHEAGPFILMQHFSYSLGTVIPPLLLGPFLSGETQETDDSKCLDSDAMISTTTAGTTTPYPLSSTTEIEIEKSRMWIPFSITGILVGLSILAQFVCYFVFKKSSKNHDKIQKKIAAEEKVVETKNDDKSESKKFKLPETRQIILTVLSGLCMAFYQATETGTMQFLPTFAHFSSVRLTESEAANVLFGLNIAFCVFRGIGIFIVLKVPPHIILFVNFVLLIVSNLIILFFGDDNVTMLWVGSVLNGVALSTTFPAYFAYIEKYLFISDTVAAVILVFGGGISSTYPYIVGSSVECNPKVMIYANLVCVGILITCYTITFWLTYFNKETKEGEGGKHGNDRGEIETSNVSNSNEETSAKY